MKVITIKQPFATLIAEGLKKYEFRTWRSKYRGELLIHAGVSVDKKAMKRYEKLNLDYPTGCIIAKVDMTDCVYIDDKMRESLTNDNPLVYYGMMKKDSDWDGYGFKLENVKKIEPIYIKGKLSLWDYEGKIIEKK